VADQEMAKFAERVLAELERVPPWSGVSLRGRPAGCVLGTGRRLVVTRGLLATSRDPRVAGTEAGGSR
jgi:hypothetical protein